MSDKPRNYEKDLRAIYNGLAESILSASDEEILEEVREEGLDPDKEAERVRNVLLSAVRDARLKMGEDAETPVVKLGEHEQQVLLAIYLLRGEGYGLSISRKMEELTSREANLGAVHV